MDLTNEAISGLRKQIKEAKSNIKDWEDEIRSIQAEFGVAEHPLKALIKKYVRLRKLKPPTDEQCQTLIDLYGEPKVVETMEAMNNWKDINKKVYFYATISNWLKRDIETATEKAKPTGRVVKDGYTPTMNEDDLKKNREQWKNTKLI